MSISIELNSSNVSVPVAQPVVSSWPKVKKAIAIALTVLMAVGFIVSYVLGAPFPVLLGFFTLALAASWPLSRKVEESSKNVLRELAN
jgi:hypothetical protein